MCYLVLLTPYRKVKQQKLDISLKNRRGNRSEFVAVPVPYRLRAV